MNAIRYATVAIARAGVLEFRGRELPARRRDGLDPDGRYRILYPAPLLRRAARTFDRVPVVIGQEIAADAAIEDFIAGAVGPGTSFEYPLLKARLAIWNGDAIEGIEDGSRRQLSIGYGQRVDMTPGFTATGHPYDGVLTEMKGRHVALVPEGRAGPKCSISRKEFRR